MSDEIKIYASLTLHLIKIHKTQLMISHKHLFRYK